MKIIIAGSRLFDNYEMLCEFCDFYLKNKSNDEIEIVSGTANGADKLGEKYAQERGYKLKQFPANWEKYKKSAGYIRNKEMAEYADALIAFWDEKSKGTKHMIDLAKEKKLKIKIVKFF
jgi:major membrane immunogen (membrane-anchored lipoprotein)